MADRRPRLSSAGATSRIAAVLLLAATAGAAAQDQAWLGDVNPGRYSIKVDLSNARRECLLDLQGQMLRRRAGRTWWVAIMEDGDGNERNCEGLGFWNIEGWTVIDGGRQVWLMPGTAYSGEWRIIFIREEANEEGRPLYRAPGGFIREGREPHDLLLRPLPAEEEDSEE